MKNDDLSECIRLFREWFLKKDASTVPKMKAILEITTKDNILIWVDYVRKQGHEPHIVYSCFGEEAWVPYNWKDEKTIGAFRSLEMLSFVKKRLEFESLSKKELEYKFSAIKTVKE